MLTIRPIQPTTDAEYQALVDINNAARPEEPTSLANRRFNDESWQKDKVFQRFVVESGDRLVVEGVYLEPFWSNAPGKYHYGYSVLPEFEEQAEVHTCVYDFVLAQLAERQPTRLSTGTREDRSHRVAWLEANGFVPKMRIAESELDITNFDFSRFNGAQERVAAAGVEMLTLAELRDKDPRWMEKLYDMLWEIEQDVPHVDPPKREPFDQFVKGFDDPDFWPEGWQMAIDPAAAGDDGIGAYVGVSMLGKNQALPQRIQTWLTGVVRSHRRKGIALAMKLRAIESAIQQGGTAIRTDNEENNPMLGINKVLGFVEIPAGVNYEKEL
jgi:GNAT superfamily N-acetyltransferase